VARQQRKVDASTSIDMPTQLLVAHLPFAFHPDPKRVALIGLASGITAGAITLHDAPGTIEIVELEPSVVHASHEFDEYNNRPLEDGRVDLFANDGATISTWRTTARTTSS
jgi:spermidine synthase